MVRLAELGAVKLCVKRSGQWELLLGVLEWRCSALLKWRDEVKRGVWYDWRAVGESMKRSAPRDLFWLWDRVSSFTYKNTIELWVMETENNQNVFSVFITHNSKIRELSYGNRVIVWPNNLFTMGPIIFELWVMETENWVAKTANPNRLKVTNHCPRRWGRSNTNFRSFWFLSELWASTSSSMQFDSNLVLKNMLCYFP